MLTLTLKKGLVSCVYQRLNLEGGDPMSSELCSILSDIGRRSLDQGNA